MRNETRKAVALKLLKGERLEDRIRTLLFFVKTEYSNLVFFVCDIDATGALGCELSDLIELDKSLKLDFSSLINLLTEDGQIIELMMKVADSVSTIMEVMVRDGQDINVISSEDRIFHENALGSFDFLDVGLFDNGNAFG